MPTDDDDMMSRGRDKEKSIEKEIYWFQIIAVVIAGSSALTNGILIAWPSPFILKISRDKVRYNITEEEASRMSLLLFIALLIFGPIFPKLSDVYGRKPLLLLTTFVDLTIWILKASGRSIYMFYIARFLVGVTDALMFAALPAYLGEVSSPTIRGTWGNSMSIFFLLGQLLVNAVGGYFPVRETSFIFMPLPILFFILFTYMPESPYFYLKNGRHDKAKESLRTLKRKTDVTLDFLCLKADVERQMSEEGSWKEMFMIDSNRRAVTAALFLSTSNAFSGGMALIVFAQYIFDKSVGTFTTEVSSMICIGVQLISSVLTCFVVELIVFRSYGMGILPTLMIAELFSTSFRAKAMTVTVMAMSVTSFITNAIFYALSSGFGIYAPFLFFACCDVVSACLYYFILPETKGKTLEEVQQSMKREKCTHLSEKKMLMVTQVETNRNNGIK
ncbi:hypothetical protein JTB14_037339 [Gonioctena quinquepunctata]|nr:hypothetical protein JTB14_037339 [Gonioctena quinquepunctata]